MDNLKESLDEEKRVANSFAKTQIEKSYYLGEYKERRTNRRYAGRGRSH